jgi:hypothetical protein
MGTLAVSPIALCNGDSNHWVVVFFISVLHHQASEKRTMRSSEKQLNKQQPFMKPSSAVPRKQMGMKEGVSAASEPPRAPDFDPK